MPRDPTFGRTTFETGIDLGGTWHIAPQTGINLASEIETVAGNGYSHIFVHEPTDESVYTHDKRVDFDMTNHTGGLHIQVEQGVEVNGTLEDWWFTVDGDGAGQNATFHLDGLHSEWEFIGDQSADPGCPGFIRIDDQNEPQIECNIRGFQNGTGNATYGGSGSVGDCTAIFLRNINGFQEGWWFRGNIRTSDRGFDTIHPNHPNASTEVSNGGGTNGFRDGMFIHASIDGRDFAVRMRGNHKGFNAVNLHLFTNEPNAAALILDGNLGGGHFGGFTVDDAPTPQTGSIAIVTESEYVPSVAPIFDGVELNEIETAISYNAAADDVWERYADGNEVGFRDFAARDGNGSSLSVDAGGELTTTDPGGEVLRVDGNGIVRTGLGTFAQGSPPDFTDGAKYSERGDPDTSELSPGECMLFDSDGTGTGDTGDLVYAVNAGGTIRTSVIGDRSNAT